MMLLQPQRPAPARTGVASSTFGRKNSSVASFTSSSNDGYDPESSRATSMHHSQSGSSRDHQPHRGYFDTRGSSPHSNQLHLPSTDESSDAEYTQFASQARRRGSKPSKQAVSHDSKLTKDGAASAKSSGGIGTLRGLGRRLFNRSSSNLKAAPLLASRSQSASSSSTSAQSPPLTPTTPPQVQPVWLPNGQKDFFSSFSGLPSSVNVADAQPHNLRTPSDTFAGISPKSRQGAFSDNHGSYDDSREHAFDAHSSQGHGSNSAFSPHSSAFALPSLPTATAAPPAFGSSLARREIPAVIEEEADSDFLRAVLNFGDGDDTSFPTPSFRGGRAAPLPTRSSSLGQIANIAASPSSFTSSSPHPPPRRTTDGRVILTQEAARDFATERPTPSYVVVNRKYRKGLFASESESEDEYGNDDEDDEGETTVMPPSKNITTGAEIHADVAIQAQREDSARYPSSFAKARTRSPGNEDSNAPPRLPGLDSAAKKALYNCTLLKVHMHLAPTLAGDAEARSQIPVIAAGEMLYGNDDLRFPRSINAESKLRQHSSTNAFSRNLHVALARTEVMRKLRRDRLRIEEEVEISWFQRRYGSASIAPEQIAKALRQRQMVSPEALAKPPIAAPQDSAVASAEGLAASRRANGVVGPEPGQKADKGGIITWAQRPSFLARTVVVLPADDFAPGEVLVSGAAKLGQRGGATSTVSFSPRIRVLAGLPSIEEERRLRYPTVTTKKFRPRDLQSKRASRLGSASDGTVWEGPERRTSSRPDRESPLASPSTKQRRLPPWMAPRSPQLLSPSQTQMLPARSASEGLAGFSTLHQNSSSASIPEVSEVNDKQDGDSSDEEVPLAQLQNFRAHRAAEKEKIQKLENEVALLRQKEVEREKEEEERKTREEEARRIEAERAYEERKAAVEARRLEKNRRILQEARDRRGFTRQSVLLAEPNYGAGNPLLGHNRPKQGSSPSSPNLALEQLGSGARSAQHDAALAKLQGQPLASRSTTSLYAQQEGQRRSRTSVAAQPEAAMSPMTSPQVRASATVASPLVDLHRQTSMASLAAPQALPHRRSMAQLPTSPQITQRRTSLLPPNGAQLHHATSMQHLAPNVSSPFLLPHAGLQHDPRHSMSMTNLHAQAFLAQQAQMGLQMPTRAAQTHGAGKVSRRQRPGLAPLVSLYGDTVPSSAMQRRN